MEKQQLYRVAQKLAFFVRVVQGFCNNNKQAVYCLSYCLNVSNWRFLQFLHEMFNVSTLLLDDALLKCVATEVVLFSVVAFKTLTFHKVV